MTTVDFKIEDLCSQIHGSPRNLASTSEQPQFESPSANALPSSSHNSPLLRSIKMEVPKFDGSDPISWIIWIEEFLLFSWHIGLSSSLDFLISHGGSRCRMVPVDESKASYDHLEGVSAKPLASFRSFTLQRSSRYLFKIDPNEP